MRLSAGEGCFRGPSVRRHTAARFDFLFGTSFRPFEISKSSGAGAYESLPADCGRSSVRASRLLNTAALPITETWPEGANPFMPIGGSPVCHARNLAWRFGADAVRARPWNRFGALDLVAPDCSVRGNRAECKNRLSVATTLYRWRLTGPTAWRLERSEASRMRDSKKRRRSTGRRLPGLLGRTSQILTSGRICYRRS